MEKVITTMYKSYNGKTYDNVSACCDADSEYYDTLIVQDDLRFPFANAQDNVRIDLLLLNTKDDLECVLTRPAVANWDVFGTDDIREHGYPCEVYLYRNETHGYSEFYLREPLDRVLGVVASRVL